MPEVDEGHWEGRWDDVSVAYIGNFTQRHCTEVHVADALEKLGCRVIPLQESTRPLDEIEAVAASTDLLLYTRTWGLADRPAAISMFRRLERSGTVTASFHLDLYVGLNREVTLDGDPFWSTQWVFTPDGDPASDEIFKARGIQHVWSPPAVHRPECVPGRYDAAFAHDVVFVGSYPYPHAEWSYRNRLVEWLQATYGAGFKRYGSGSTTIRNEPLNDLYASASVVVGDSLCPGFTKPGYWSDRLTETLGRGGVLVWPRIDGVAEQGFIDGIHYLGYDFGDFDGLKARIDFLLANDVLARQMADRAQRFVAEHHTYRNRMATLLETVGL